MINITEFIDVIKEGASGNADVAIQACKTIIKEDLLFDGFRTQSIPPRASFPKREGLPRIGDKGKEMPARFSRGECPACTQPILAGQVIYYKSSGGSTHKECADAVGVLVPTPDTLTVVGG